MKKFVFKICSIALCLLLFSTVIINAPEIQAFDKTAAKKEISVTYKKLPDGILAIYKNKNKYPVKLTAIMHFQDFDKKDIKAIKEYNYCFAGDSSSAIFFPAPRDEYGNCINYTSYKSSFSVAKSKFKSYSKKIATTTDFQTITANLSAMNMSEKKLENIHATLVFYDSKGKIIGCCGKYLSCYEKNKMDIYTVNYDLSWGKPAKAKVYIDWAY